MQTLARTFGEEVPLGRNFTIEDATITPAQAHIILQTVSDRFGRVTQATGLSETSIRKYERQILSGAFKPHSTIQFAYVKSDPSIIYLINGRHRLTAVKRSNIAHGLAFIVQFRAVDTLEEVLALLDTHDDHQGRNGRDRDLIKELDKELGLGKDEMTQLGGAVELIVSGMVPMSKALDQVGASINADSKRDWAPYFKQYMAIVQAPPETGESMGLILGRVRARLQTAPAIALFMVALRSCPKLAKPFLMMVSTNQDYSSSADPVVALAQFLNDANSRQRLAFLHCIARCWNAYVDNTTVKTPRISNTTTALKKKPAPLKLGCTPYHGEKHRCYVPYEVPEDALIRHRGIECEMLTADQIDEFAVANATHPKVRKKLAALESNPLLR